LEDGPGHPGRGPRKIETSSPKEFHDNAVKRGNDARMRRRCCPGAPERLSPGTFLHRAAVLPTKSAHASRPGGERPGPRRGEVTASKGGGSGHWRLGSEHQAPKLEQVARKHAVALPLWQELYQELRAGDEASVGRGIRSSQAQIWAPSHHSSSMRGNSTSRS